MSDSSAKRPSSKPDSSFGFMVNGAAGPKLLPARDEEFLNALARQDETAQNELLISLGPKIRSGLRMRLRSDLVEDAYQETFLRVFSFFRSGKTLNSISSLRGFVQSVSHNVMLERIRAQYRHSQFPENMPEPADNCPTPEDESIVAERKQAVRQVLSELSERDRDLLRSTLLEEEDTDLACRRFGVDRGYLRVLRHRARLRFKMVLEQRATPSPPVSVRADACKNRGFRADASSRHASVDRLIAMP